MGQERPEIPERAVGQDQAGGPNKRASSAPEGGATRELCKRVPELILLRAVLEL